MSNSLTRLAGTAAFLTALMFAGCQDDVPVTSVGGSDWKPVFTMSNSLNPCLDGQAAHNSSNCTSCAGSDFTFNTTASTADVLQDLSQSGFCGETNAVLYFDTSNLNNAQCGVQSATFSFAVHSVLSLDVDEMRVRVYAMRGSGVCPLSLTSQDFVGCGSGYVDLGVFTITGTGWVNVPVPNPASNLFDFSANFKHHQVKFVLVDASVFSSGSGYQRTKIVTNEGANKPKLDVVTYDCFQTCLDGTIVHDPNTACTSCSPNRFTSVTTQIYLEAYHSEPDPECSHFLDGALMFDTSSLDDAASISSAKLSFNVAMTEYIGVNVPYVQVYAVTRSSCPSSLGKTDFPPCNSELVSLGTVYISGTGFHSITIPNPNAYVSKSGVTEFVVADASSISYLPGQSGSAWTVISAAEDEARFRPRLEIKY